MRKYYIDNLRILCIFMLFQYHTCMLYNTFEKTFYVYNKPVNILSDFILINSTWFMPIMFVLAGISSAYALRKRTGKEYIKERVLKLLVPFVFGLLLLVPLQTYYAEVFHNNYTGSYIEQYILFFTKETNLTGYSGGFTPAHLWFILYLFFISMLALPIMLWYNKSKKQINIDKLSMLKIILMLFIPLSMTPILNIAGMSFGGYFALFVLGFFVFSEDKVLEKLEKYRWALTASALLLLITRHIWYYLAQKTGILFDIHQCIAMWICILAILGLGKRFFNFNNKFTQYFAKASFPIYIFHQSVLIVVGYYILKITDIISIQVILIMSISFIATIICYEVFKRLSLTRLMFGIKK